MVALRPLTTVSKRNLRRQRTMLDTNTTNFPRTRLAFVENANLSLVSMAIRATPVDAGPVLPGAHDTSVTYVVLFSAIALALLAAAKFRR